MSTYYGIRCKTCDEATHCEIKGSTGTTVLKNVIALAHHFDAINNGDELGYIEITIMAHSSDPISFVSLHVGHDMVVYDEYGEDVPPE